MKVNSVKLVVSIALALIFASSIASAQEPDAQGIIPEKKKVVDADVAVGWHPALRLKATFALTDSKNVPGGTEGTMMNFGYMLTGAADYLNDSKEHEWLNALNLQLGFTRTETLGLVTKSTDIIDFKTSYLYHIPAVQWLGPFVSFRLTTSMLSGYDVRPDAVDVIKMKNGEKFENTTAGTTIDSEGNILDAGHPRATHYNAKDKIDLTGPFAPLTLKESVGLFAVPVSKESLRLDFRAGFGAWETFVRGGYTLDADTAVNDLVVLRQMQDSVQIGPEIGLLINGQVDDNVNYLLGAGAMQPVYHNADTDLEGIELMNLEFEVRFGVKLAKWLSVDYSFKAVKQPLLVDKWQVQNNLLVSIGFDLIATEEPAPVEEKCDCPVEEATAEEATEETATEETPAEPPAEETAPAPEEEPAPVEEAPAEEAPAEETPA